MSFSVYVSNTPLSNDVQLLAGNGTGPTGPTGPSGSTGPVGPQGLLSITGTNYGDYIYWDTGNSAWTVGSTSIKIGNSAGQNNQDPKGIAIGSQAGYDNQQQNSIAIGSQAGNILQIGGIAIGSQAGNIFQNGGIAIGTRSGNYQQNGGIAIGTQAGFSQQNGIAIGNWTGVFNQGTESIAIGTRAGYISQQPYSIAIGCQAGLINQVRSIILNASSQPLNGGNVGFYANPVRSATYSNVLFYDDTNKEITYGAYTQTYETVTISGSPQTVNGDVEVSIIEGEGPGDLTLSTPVSNRMKTIVSGNLTSATIRLSSPVILKAVQYTTLSLDYTGSSVQMYWNGTNWIIISQTDITLN